MKMKLTTKEKRFILLGHAIVRALELKDVNAGEPGSRPLFSSDQGHKTYLGLGRLVFNICDYNKRPQVNIWTFLCMRR